jgi:hypothetical protein
MLPFDVMSIGGKYEGGAGKPGKPHKGKPGLPYNSLC